MIPGYEDAFYYTWKERRLPSNVTPEKSNLKDKLERERIARIFQKGLGEVVGYTLPIKRCMYGNQPGWMSGAWFLRDDDTLWLIRADAAQLKPLDRDPEQSQQRSHLNVRAHHRGCHRGHPPPGPGGEHRHDPQRLENTTQ